jgi:hypothetical protein
MYIKKSVLRPSGNPGAGIRPRDIVSLIDVEDVAFMPSPDDKGVVVADNIVMKLGRYAFNIYMTPGTVEITSAADGDTDKVGFTPSIKFEHPGNEQEVREFKANSINKKFIIVVRYCSGKPSDMIGTICNPCKFTPSYTGNNESNSTEMTFAQISKGDDIFIYKGTLTEEEPVSVIAAGAKEVVYAGNGQYQLTGGDVIIESISGGSEGAVVTLIGSGSTGGIQSIANSDTILIRQDSFVLSEGTQITLVAFDRGEKGIVWVEQSRYES